MTGAGKPDTLRRVLGGVLGTAAGVGLQAVLVGEGMQSVAVSGAGVAVGLGILARGRRWSWGLAGAVVAPLVSLVSTWWLTAGEESFLDYLGGIGGMSANTHLSLGVVAAAGLWFGSGRSRPEGSLPA